MERTEGIAMEKEMPCWSALYPLPTRGGSVGIGLSPHLLLVRGCVSDFKGKE